MHPTTKEALARDIAAGNAAMRKVATDLAEQVDREMMRVVREGTPVAPFDSSWPALADAPSVKDLAVAYRDAFRPENLLPPPLAGRWVAYFPDNDCLPNLEDRLVWHPVMDELERRLPRGDLRITFRSHLVCVEWAPPSGVDAKHVGFQWRRQELQLGRVINHDVIRQFLSFFVQANGVPVAPAPLGTLGYPEIQRLARNHPLVAAAMKHVDKGHLSYTEGLEQVVIELAKREKNLRAERDRAIACMTKAIGVDEALAQMTEEREIFRKIAAAPDGTIEVTGGRPAGEELAITITAEAKIDPVEECRALMDRVSHPCRSPEFPVEFVDGGGKVVGRGVAKPSADEPGRYDIVRLDPADRPIANRKSEIANEAAPPPPPPADSIDALLAKHPQTPNVSPFAAGVAACRTAAVQ